MADLDLDKNLRAIKHDLHFRGSKSCAVAKCADIAMLIGFYALIIYFVLNSEYMYAAIAFGLQTLWKISMALQDVIHAVNLLNIFEIIKVSKND